MKALARCSPWGPKSRVKWKNIGWIIGNIKSVHGRYNLVSGHWVRTSVCISKANVHLDKWTWPGLWSSSNTCPTGPCPSRNRISRSSHPVTLTDWPSTGSSLHSSWHTMTWDKADFNPFLWEILQPVLMEGGPQEKNLLAHSGQRT